MDTLDKNPSVSPYDIAEFDSLNNNCGLPILTLLLKSLKKANHTKI